MQTASNTGCFMEGTPLTQHGQGARLVLWGFRIGAMNRASSHCVGKHLKTLLGDDGAKVGDCLWFFAHCMATVGRRAIDLAVPGHIHMTRDEASILAAVSAAQGGDFRTRNAHLYWLMADDAPLSLTQSVDIIADTLLAHGIDVLSPDYRRNDLTSKAPSALSAALPLI